jgi:hypothetical protein
MGYGYTCEDCGGDYPDEDPALMGQLHERWFKTTDRGGLVAERFGLSPEETLTLCGPCLLDLLEGR